jgi:hypothetical protein
MPTLILTAEQAEQVRPILELQKARKIGCLAVVNIGFDRASGERTIELTFTALEWSDAISICAKIQKLRAAVHAVQPLAESGAGSSER